jgi:hypothetical protein
MRESVVTRSLTLMPLAVVVITLAVAVGAGSEMLAGVTFTGAS